MRFGKRTMFLLFNGLILLLLVVYYLPWLFSKTTIAAIVHPYESTRVHVRYVVKGIAFTNTFLRNDISTDQERLVVRYLKFHPSSSRPNSFMGFYAEPLAWWAVFLLASAMALLTDNAVFSKGTVFEVSRKFPWISMEEYFPVNSWWHFYRGETQAKPGGNHAGPDDPLALPDRT